LLILGLIKQGHLIEENGSEDDQLSSEKALHRNLAAPFEYVFEQAIEGFDSFRSQEMEDLANCRALIEMRCISHDLIGQ